MTDIDFDHDFLRHLDLLGIWMTRTGVFPLHPDTAIEPPVTIMAADIWLEPATIGAFTYINARSSVSAVRCGRYCSIARGVEIGLPQHPLDHITTSPVTYCTDFLNFERHFADGDTTWRRALPVAEFHHVPQTVIGNDVWIGAGAYIRDGVTIGDGAVIGARSVVTKDVPPYAVVAGSPARVIRQRFDDAMVERLLALRWWDYNILDFGGWDAAHIDTAVAQLEEAIAADSVARYTPATINLTDEHMRYREIRRLVRRMSICAPEGPVAA